MELAGVVVEYIIRLIGGCLFRRLGNSFSDQCTFSCGVVDVYLGWTL